MSEVTVIQPTYDEFVAQFSWDQVLAHFDWPVTEKFNLGHELCDRWAKHPTRADALAMRYETKDGSQGGYTYRQLRDLSNRFAAALTRLGIQRGDRVAGLMPKIPCLFTYVARHLENRGSVCANFYRFCRSRRGLSVAR